MELDIHTGIRDKTLAEFIIDLANKSTNEQEFKDKLNDFDADFTA
jgi:ATP-dependent RNA helicase DHX8/PRP22